MPRPAVGTSGIPSGGVPGEITGWAPDEVDVPDRDVLTASGSAISAAAVATRGAAVVTIGGSVASGLAGLAPAPHVRGDQGGGQQAGDEDEARHEQVGPVGRAGQQAGRLRLGQRGVVDQPGGLQVADVPGDVRRAVGGELADQVVAGADPHLREDRQHDAVGLAQPLHRGAVVVRAGLGGDLLHPPDLLGVRAGRQRHAELVGDVAGLLVEVGVLGGDLPAGLLDGRAGALLLHLLPGGHLPQAGEADLHDQVTVRRGERTPLRGDDPGHAGHAGCPGLPDCRADGEDHRHHDGATEIAGRTALHRNPSESAWGANRGVCQAVFDRAFSCVRRSAVADRAFTPCRTVRCGRGVRARRGRRAPRACRGSAREGRRGSSRAARARARRPGRP